MQSTVVITRGQKGVIVASASGIFGANSFPIEFVDGTGGGDAFAAGYIHALLAGGDVNECVRVAALSGQAAFERRGQQRASLGRRAGRLLELANARPVPRLIAPAT